MSKKAEANEPKQRELLATGGGNATASGVSFQASVAAYFASQGLAEAPLDARLGLGTAKPTGFRFETEAPVDDILISLDTSGWAFIQGKNSLTNSASLTSELGKTCDEFARLWEAASTGSGTHGWDRPLTAGIDVMVIAVGPTTSGTIKHHLARAFDNARNGASATLSQDQANALNSFRNLMGKALTARGGAVAGLELPRPLGRIDRHQPSPAGMLEDRLQHAERIRGLNDLLPAMGAISIVAVLLLALIGRRRPIVLSLYLAAAALMIVAALITRFGNQRINAVVMTWSGLPPADWESLPDSWWSWHQARLAAGVAAELLLITGALADRSVPRQRL